MNDLLDIFFKDPLWQSIWFLAFVFGVFAFLHKNDKKLYLYIMLSQFFWIIHFCMIALYVWAFVNVISFFRTYIALKYKKNIKVIFLFILFYIIIGLLNYEGFISLFPIFAGIFWTLAFLYFSWIKWRLLLLFCSFLWLIYNFIWGSLGWIITELFMIVAWNITVFRLIKKTFDLKW